MKAVTPPYGSVPVKREPLLRRLIHPAMLLAHTLALPAIATSWMLFPLWFIPLHKMTWGRLDMDDTKCAAGVIHVLAALVVLTSYIYAGTHMSEHGRFWWQTKKKDTV